MDAEAGSCHARLLYFGPVGNRAASAVNVAGGGFDGSAVVRFDAGPSPRDRSAVKKRPATDGPPQDIRISTDEGSLLIFPNVELRWESSGALVQDTFLTLQNNASGAVKVRVVFVNGDDPGPPERDHGAQPERTARDIEPGWNHVDDLVELTANQPMYWSALTGQPAGVLPFTALDPGFPPGRSDPEGSGQRVLRGFIYAWAVNDAGHEIRWNHLTGGATIVNYDEATASEYRAYASAVVDPAVPVGGVTGTPGVLNLDGAEFAPGFDLLQFDFVASGAGPFSGPLSVVANTDLTIHPISIDFQEANAGPLRTNAEVRIWNQNESLLSGTRRCITFWDQTLVSNYDEPNHFWLMHLQTNTGRARIDGESNITCVDSVPVSLLGIAVRTLSFDVGATVEHSANNLVGLGTESASIVFDPPCLPDLNGNGSVDFADILAIIGAWGPCGVPCPEDLSGNGQVDFADLLVVISAWGACP